ncbi:secretagogin-like, partial [Scleropages formosus]
QRRLDREARAIGAQLVVDTVVSDRSPPACSVEGDGGPVLASHPSQSVSSMESALGRLDAARFLEIWQHFDVDDKGHIEGRQLDHFFRHMMKKLGFGDKVTDDKVQQLKKRFLPTYDAVADGHLQIEELANMMLPEDENFLLLFRRETPLDNSVEFMRIWRNYDADSSGYISAVELKSFLQDLFHQHKKVVSLSKLEEYTDAIVMPRTPTTLHSASRLHLHCFKFCSLTNRSFFLKFTSIHFPRLQMKMFDKNKDGRLDLNDLARILALQENFLLKFKMDACSQEDRRRDFEAIFAHYDVSKTGALEGPEVDGFVKDMMELVKPSISGADLDKFRQVLLGHCDVNRDGKIQKNELALCLGLKLNP